MLCFGVFSPPPQARHDTVGYGEGTEAGLGYRRPRTLALPAASCFQSAAVSEVIDVSANWELF